MVSESESHKRYRLSPEGRTQNREAQRRYAVKHGKQRSPNNNAATAKYRATNIAKRRATNAVNNALARGVILRPRCCSECGARTRLNAHHDDYAEPLAIRWLCISCHNDWHNQNGEAANGN